MHFWVITREICVWVNFVGKIRVFFVILDQIRPVTLFWSDINNQTQTNIDTIFFCTIHAIKNIFLNIQTKNNIIPHKNWKNVFVDNVVLNVQWQWPTSTFPPSPKAYSLDLKYIPVLKNQRRQVLRQNLTHRLVYKDIYIIFFTYFLNTIMSVNFLYV